MGDFRPKFVLFGDSLTQQSFRPGGWGALLQDEYSRKADVVVRGYGGYNTAWGLCLLHHIFPKGNNSNNFPKLVTVFFGANDAALEHGTSKKQFVSLIDYENNLKKIVSHIQESTSNETNIIIITPPPIDEDGRLRYAKSVYGENAFEQPERTNENTKKYVDVCEKVGKVLNINVINLWQAISSRPNWQSMLSDGLHFTEEGNKVVYEELTNMIKNKLPSIYSENLPFDFPHFSEIDENDLSKSFSIPRS